MSRTLLRNLVWPALVAGCGMVSLTAQADYQSTVLSDAPVAYWRLGEMPVTLADPYIVTNSGSLGASADGSFVSYVGRGEPGALVGSTDTAMRFWATISFEQSRIAIGNPAAFNFTGDGTATPFTLETWAKPMSTPSGSQRLIANGSSGQGYALTLYGANQLRLTAFGVADVTSDAAASPFASNQWYHVVAVRGPSTVTFYLNGTQLGAVKALANIKTTANALALGRRPDNSEPFTGVLDEAAVFPTALTAARVAAHYGAAQTNAAGYAGIILADSPIGYWRLNEPKKPESTTVIANSGSLGTAANGAVFGPANSITGGITGAVTGDANPAMGFAGGGAKIDVPYSAGINPTSFTCECWARLDTWNNAYQSPFSSRYVLGGAAQGLVFYAAPFNSAPRWEFWSGNGTAMQNANSGVADVVQGKWTHLVGTFDAATGIKVLYVDGQIAAGTVNQVYVPNALAPTRIAGGANEGFSFNAGDYFWSGGLDEVAVYPTALSPDRVQVHYKAALGVAPDMSVAPTIGADAVSKTNWAPYATTLGCVVKGSWPMQLQWYRLGDDGITATPVPNATNMNLTFFPSDPTNSGYYFLTATNALGGVAGTPAWLEINTLTAPTFTIVPPTPVPVYVGGTAGVPSQADGTPPLRYQWQSNSVDIAGATNAILALTNIKASHASANFLVKVTNPATTITSGNVQLNVLTPPPTTYAAVATGLNPLAYWRLGDTAGNFAFDSWGGHPAVYANALQGMTPGALLDNDDGGVGVYGVDSYVRTLEVAPFSFSGVQSFTLSAFVKANAFPATDVAARIFSNWQVTGTSGGYGFGFLGNTILRFTAFGIKDVNASVPKFETDQWYHVAAVRSNTTVYIYIDGVLVGSDLVTDMRASTYPLQLGGNPATPTTESFNGTIDEAAVFNRALTSSEIAALYVGRYGALNPPTITRQPAPAKVFAGGTARFDVVAIGSQPIGYQWKANGSPIAGATTSRLVLSPVTTANNGVNYTVTLTNSAGTLTSDPALLTVTQPAAYAAAVAADKPIAFWRLDELAGPVVYDYWGAFNGKDNGAVGYGATGALLNDADTAGTFDFNAKSRVEIPYTPTLNPAVFTVEAWARVTGGAGTYRAVISTRDEQSGVYQKGFILYATSGNIWSFWTSPGNGWESLDGPAVVEGEWTHLAAVYDGQTKYFYVNGQLVGTVNALFAPNDLRPLRIGEGRNEKDPGEYQFTGDLDEVAVYSTALSAERIAYHYAYGKYSTTTPPFFLTKPIPNTIAAGRTATLRSMAGGSPALAYQWSKDGAAIPGATAPSLVLTSVTYSASGTYEVTVTNSLRATNSGGVKLTIVPTPQFANATNDLVLHLSFDGDYNDVSGRGNNGSPVGLPSFVPGKIGANALHYSTDTASGSYNYVTLGSPTDLLFSTNVNFSVSFWVKFTGTPGDLPFLCSAVGSYSRYGITFAPSYKAGGWSWSLGDVDSYIGVNGPDNSINDGQWHHLVHTFDRAGLAVTYLDGVEVNVSTISAAGDIDAGAAFNIGQDPGGVYAEDGAADLDDLAVWRRVLTPAEALGLYNAGQAGRSLDAYGPVQLGVERAADGLYLVWQAGTLLQSDSVSGSYTPVPGASAPLLKLAPNAAQKFYRVRL